MKSLTALSLAVASLLVLTGLAAAEPTSSPSSGSEPSSSPPAPPPSGNGTSPPPSDRPCANESTEQGRQSCLKRYCEQNEDPRCPTSGNSTSKPPKAPESSKPGDGAKPTSPANGSKEPAACDTKGNPEFCRAKFCQEHKEAAFCRPVAAAIKDLKDAVKDAADRRKVGAEVALTRAAGQTGVQIFSYDNVTVKVDGTDHVASKASPLSIRLSSNLTEGRTFSFTVNKSLLPAADADRLVLRYFDVHADGQTEVLFQKASSLADVLNPADDNGQPEYWVVQDANGVQVLISVPHWSTHIVTLGGLDAIVQPTVLVGLVAGLAASALAAVALFIPRRRDD